MSFIDDFFRRVATTTRGARDFFYHPQVAYKEPYKPKTTKRHIH